MKTEAQLQSQIYAFNKNYPRGEKVKVKMDNGKIKRCTIKFPATIMGGHTAVVWLHEFETCYELDRIVI